MSIESYLDRIEVLQQLDPNIDLRHAAEELGEVAKAMRRLDDHIASQDCDPSTANSLRHDVQAEAVDLAICAFSLFLQAGGMAPDFHRCAEKALKRWQKQKE